MQIHHIVIFQSDLNGDTGHLTTTETSMEDKRTDRHRPGCPLHPLLATFCAETQNVATKASPH